MWLWLLPIYRGSNVLEALLGGLILAALLAAFGIVSDAFGLRTALVERIRVAPFRINRLLSARGLPRLPIRGTVGGTILWPNLQDGRLYLKVNPQKTDDYKVSIVGPTVMKSAVPFPMALQWTENGRGFTRLVEGTPALVKLCDVKFTPPREPFGATLDIMLCIEGAEWAEYMTTQDPEGTSWVVAAPFNVAVQRYGGIAENFVINLTGRWFMGDTGPSEAKLDIHIQGNPAGLRGEAHRAFQRGTFSP